MSNGNPSRSLDEVSRIVLDCPTCHRKLYYTPQNHSETVVCKCTPAPERIFRQTGQLTPLRAKYIENLIEAIFFLQTDQEIGEVPFRIMLEFANDPAGRAERGANANTQGK